MTGLDCLREEMKKRGCSKQQIKSETAAIVLDILSNSGTINTDIVEAEKQLAETQRKNERELQWLKIRADEIRHQQEDVAERENKLKEQKANFLKSLLDCETPEGRDAIKRAQFFINSISVDTRYDNTAFINGLGAILSNGGFDAIEELKKVNPKLFENGNAKLSKPYSRL